MKFVALQSLKEGVDEAKLEQLLRNRAEYEFPEGIKPIAEYWGPKDSPAVISIFEADDAAPILESTVPWIDYFETTDLFPVVSVDEGLGSISG